MKARNLFEFGSTSEERRKDVSDNLIITSDRSLICSPIDFGVPMYGGKRTAPEQNSIYVQGYSKCDGYNKLSKHQEENDEGKGLALDLVPYIPGKGFRYDAYGRFGIIGMLMLEAWEELQEVGEIPKDKYLHWGGFWKSRDGIKLGWDLAHFEERDYPQIIRL